jgi:hypothetical protein
VDPLPLKRILAEPLVHFLVLGAALFAIYGVSDGGEARDDAIVVTPARIEQLAAGFARVWQRPPTTKELAGLVDDFIREEVYYREALALGLDRDDTIVRRRLRQKIEFLTEGATAGAEPTEAELASFLAADPGRFRVESRVSFRQIYLNPERRGDRVEDDARALLERLERTPGAEADSGDPFLLPDEYSDSTESDVRHAFGAEFVRQLLEAEPGRWTGPLGSSYGLHLVFIDEVSTGRPAELAEVREAVEREWRDRHRREQAEAFYAALLERYEVTVEWPEPREGGEDPP